MAYVIQYATLKPHTTHVRTHQAPVTIQINAVCGRSDFRYKSAVNLLRARVCEVAAECLFCLHCDHVMIMWTSFC